MNRIPPLETWQPLGEAVTSDLSLTVSATDSSTTWPAMVIWPPRGHAITMLFPEPPTMAAAVSF